MDNTDLSYSNFDVSDYERHFLSKDEIDEVVEKIKEKETKEE